MMPVGTRQTRSFTVPYARSQIHGKPRSGPGIAHNSRYDSDGVSSALELFLLPPGALSWICSSFF